MFAQVYQNKTELIVVFIHYYYVLDNAELKFTVRIIRFLINGL